MVLTASYIQELKEETSKIIAICSFLNKDNVFIEKINASVVSNNSNGLLLKTEHFFLSDCIAMYNLCLGKENDKARFTLAFYYDALRNSSFANEKEAKSLNALVSTENFKKHISKIRHENSLLWTKPTDQKYFIPAVLVEINNPKQEWILDKYQNFIQYCFDVTFDSKKDFEAFIGLKVNARKIENSDVTTILEHDTLEIVLKELEQLIGLEEVKKDVYELINLLEIQKKRSSEGLKNIDVTLHTVFLGPPGTGKTSVARLLSRIFKHLGFLSKGQMYGRRFIY
jgi:SpoVK/Ycf46/Vps4 family AAA+-type ATPase